jgi:hypothetical protein
VGALHLPPEGLGTHQSVDHTTISEAGSAEPGEFDFLEYIEERLQGIFGQDYKLEIEQPEELANAFAGLTADAAETPDVIADIDTRIAELTDQVNTLKQEIADTFDNDLIAQGMLTAVEGIADEIVSTTGETFDKGASAAIAAFMARFKAEKSKLEDELETQLGAAANAAGITAGRGLMDAFARGIEKNDKRLLGAVDAVLAEVRARLPSSDAKKGPLSDLTYSGRMLLRTFMKGAERERSRVAGSMNRLLQVARPTAALAGFSPAAASGLGGGPVQLNVDARREAAPGPMALNARRLVSDVERELQMKGLMRRR